jgi:hypothetical protein
MEPYRPLRFTFFIYDFIRLIVMTRLLMALGSEGNGGFPYIFYAAPNGLFPLMSFFLWIRLNAYKPYIALYMAGKILAVVAVFAWLIFSLPNIADILSANNQETYTVIGTVLLLSAGDTLTVLGGAVLKRRIQGKLRARMRSADLRSNGLRSDVVPEGGKDGIEPPPGIGH